MGRWELTSADSSQVQGREMACPSTEKSGTVEMHIQLEPPIWRAVKEIATMLRVIELKV
jgi:hypothetical protein